MNCHLDSGPLYDSVLFRHIYNGIGKIPNFPDELCALDYFISGFIIMFILVNGVLLGAAIFIWAERRILGRFQNRLGPNRWGPFGLLQPIADLLKLLTKEDLIPRGADRLAFTLVPIVMVMPLILMMAVIPFAKNTLLADLNIGVLYIVAVTSVTTLGIFMAGWSSGNRFAMFGAMRGVAMLISYEIPTVLALVGVVLLAGSMKITDVVDAQTLPFLLVQPSVSLSLFWGFRRNSTARPLTSWKPSQSLLRAIIQSTAGPNSSLFRPPSSVGWLLPRRS